MVLLAFSGIRRPGLIALVMALGVSMASVARAAEVVLRVDGMACPFCAFGVEKKLLRVSAVAGLDILLDDGKVILQLRKGERLDVVALHRAVEAAGFDLRKILVENAVGSLSQNDAGELLLECSDPLVAFRLRLEVNGAHLGIIPVRGTTPVEVTGELTEYRAEPALLVTRFLRVVGDVTGGAR